MDESDANVPEAEYGAKPTHKNTQRTSIDST